MEKEKFNALKALTEPKEQSFNAKELLNALTEMSKSVRIKSDLDFLDAPKNKLRGEFFKSNNRLIRDKIKLNKNIKATLGKLADDKKKDFTIQSTEVFTQQIVEMFLSTEVNYLIHLKEIYKDSQRERIEGELLSFDTRDEIFTMNKKPFDELISKIGIMVYLYSALLSRKEDEGIEALRLYKKSIQAKPEIKPKLSEQDRFIENIRKAKNRIIAKGGKPNKRAVAIELEIADSTFRDRLKDILRLNKISFEAI